MPKVTLGQPQPLPGALKPATGAGTGPVGYALLGAAGALTQFGAHVEVLPPGSRSLIRHWHEAGDELVFVLSGDLMLIEDTEAPLQAGEAACWPAGLAVPRCLENRSDQDAMVLVIGARNGADRLHAAGLGLAAEPPARAPATFRTDPPERPD